jgi:hypothetical protein
MTIAAGSFEITMTTQPPDDHPDGSIIARQLLIKRYEGALSAEGRGQMLAVMGQTKGCAGYVALEVVSGTLDGRAGRFALQHFGVMDHGRPELRVAVVPDSGTDDLKGLSGVLTIDVASGKHAYSFDYQITP